MAILGLERFSGLVTVGGSQCSGNLRCKPLEIMAVRSQWCPCRVVSERALSTARAASRTVDSAPDFFFLLLYNDEECILAT